MAIYLRWTANIGPAPAFPIWTLFLALGLVAALGGGFFLIVEPEEGDLVPVESTPHQSRSTPGAVRARPLPRHFTSLPVRWTESILPSVAVPAEPPADVFDDAVQPATATGPAESPEFRPDPAWQVLAELDRVISDLRPARLNRPQL